MVSTGNIGYGQSASQSGDLRDSWTADRALDGRGFGTGDFGLDHCAHTNARELSTDAYWTVDLGKKHQILNVTIYNRQRGKCNFKLLYWPLVHYYIHIQT